MEEIWSKRKQHGKNPEGIKNGRVKLTEEDVLDIRSFYRDGMSHRMNAAIHAVSEQTIYDIISRRSWKHLI